MPDSLNVLRIIPRSERAGEFNDKYFLRGAEEGRRRRLEMEAPQAQCPEENVVIPTYFSDNTEAKEFLTWVLLEHL